MPSFSSLSSLPCRVRRLSLLMLAGSFLVCIAVPNQALAQTRKNYAKGSDFKGGQEGGVRKKKYIHPCAGGTEQVGKPPQEGGTVVFCRQPVTGGYRKQGPEISWYSNGQKHFEGEYSGDKKHGRWIVYDRNGRKKFTEEWYNGKLVKRLELDKNGQPAPPDKTDEIRKQKQQQDSWRKEVRTKVVQKKQRKDSGWVKKGGNRQKVKLF